LRSRKRTLFKRTGGEKEDEKKACTFGDIDDVFDGYIGHDAV
jgi:hypothetical protein